jgi:WXG100 family type VII secretion target
MFQLNYELLASIAQQFKDEGEDMVKLHSGTRQRVQSLHKEWIGEAAEKFFEEMESELLPALQRLSQALFRSQDVTGEIMKIIQEADEETVGYFENQLAGDDFGAGMFGQALEGLPGGSPGSDDFGAGSFEEALRDTTSAPAESGSSTLEDDKQPMESQEQRGDRQEQGGGGGQSEKQSKEQEQETEPTPAGGGGGGSSSTEGLQGDLKNMGIGLSNQAPQWATTGSGATVESMPDHIYANGASPLSADESQPVTNEQPDSSGQASGSNIGSIAAGAAGIAGAAAAGKAAKAIRDEEEEDK